MYCPNCGRENSEKQRFCTSCGLNLPVISQVSGSERTVAKYGGQVSVSSQPEPKIWQNPLVYGLFMIFTGLFMMILGKKGFHDQTISDIGTVIALIGASLLGLKGLFLTLQQAGIPLHLPKQETKQQQMPLRQQSSLQPGESVSVTEHTTRHLDAVPV